VEQRNYEVPGGRNNEADVLILKLFVNSRTIVGFYRFDLTTENEIAANFNILPR
jgi:hypothetical protein